MTIQVSGAIQVCLQSAIDIRDYYSFSQLFPPGKLMFFLSTTDTTLRAIYLWDDAAFDEDEIRSRIIPLFEQRLRKGQVPNELPEPAKRNVVGEI